MVTNSFTEAVHEALLKALETVERKVIAQESGIEYHTLSAFLKRKTAGAPTLNALYNVLTARGYLDTNPTTIPTYQLRDATKMVIANDLRNLADIIASDMPVRLKADKLAALAEYIPAYIGALQGDPAYLAAAAEEEMKYDAAHPPQKKRRKTS